MEKIIRFLYLKVMGEAVLIEKTDRTIIEISIYILLTNFFIWKRAFFVIKLSSIIPNIFSNAITLSLECCLAKSGISLPIFRNQIAFLRYQIFSIRTISRICNLSRILPSMAKSGSFPHKLEAVLCD